LLREIKNTVKVASIYISTIIGAGFASGQEIVQFFSKYYEKGFYGIILAGVLFALIGLIVLDKVYRERIRNYDEFLFPTVGWFMGWVMEIAVTLFFMSLFCVMIAGMGNIISNRFGVPLKYCVMIITLICMAVVLTDIKGIATLSTVVTPLLIMGILVIGLYIIVFRDTSAFNAAYCVEKATRNWFFSSILYVGYNSLMSIVVMCGLLPLLFTRSVGIAGGFLGGLSLCAIALVINTVLLTFSPDSLADELPILEIANRYGATVNAIYSIVLFTAMFLSAVNSGYCLLNRIGSKIRVNAKILAFAICILAVPLSGFGFSNLISTVYPFFGYLGLFMVIAVLIEGVKLFCDYSGTPEL